MNSNTNTQGVGHSQPHPFTRTTFPGDIYPHPVREYARLVGEDLGTGDAQALLLMMGAFSAAVGSRLYVKAKSTLVTAVTQWIVMVGESGTMKSPILNAVMGHFRELDRLDIDGVKAWRS